MSASVLVATGTPVYPASWRVVRISFIVAARAVTAAMPPVSAVTEEVHRDEGDADQHPEPVCHEPLHVRVPFNVSSQVSVNSSSVSSPGHSEDSELRCPRVRPSRG